MNQKFFRFPDIAIERQHNGVWDNELTVWGSLLRKIFYRFP